MNGENSRALSLPFAEKYQGVSIRYQPKILRMQNDEALRTFLDLPENGSMALAGQMLDRYQQLFSVPLAISQASIAVEILGHVFADNVAKALAPLSEKLSPRGAIAEALASIRQRTEVIDIGEKDVDNNRWLWDALVPFRHIIFAACGRGA